MSNIRLILALLICLKAFDQGLLAADIDSPLQREILAHWAELEKVDDARTAIDASWERQGLEGPSKEKKEGTSRYRRNGGAARISSESAKIDEVVQNSKYIFVVARDSSAQPWAMRFVELDLASDKARQLQEATFLARIVDPLSAVYLGSFARQQRKVNSLADDAKLKMISSERLPEGLVRIHYQYEQLTGEFDCDPDAHYVVKRGRSTLKNATVQYDMKYERHFSKVGAASLPVVDRFEYEVVSSLGVRLKDTTNYSYPNLAKTGELDDEQFRLTAYGLPEPEGIVWEKPRRWLPYWLTGGGILVVLLSTLLLRKMRRGSPAEARS